jgi:hypothetical protein
MNFILLIIQHLKKIIIMTGIEAIEKIKIMLGLEKTKEKFEKTASLMDGTEVYVEDEFIPGAQLSVITEEGLIPAPEGTHILENGTAVTVDAAGIIVEVSEAEAEAEEMAEEVKEEMAEEVKEEMTSEIVEAIAEVLAPIVSEMEKVKEELEKIKGDFNKFSAAPAANPVTNNFSAPTKTDSRIETLRRMKNQK